MAVRPSAAVDVYADLEGLPPCYESLFRTAEAKAFCHGLPWYRNLIGSTAEPGERLHIYGLTTEGNCPEALLLARQRSSGPRLLGGAELAGCSNLYSLRFAPLVRPGQNRADQVANGFVEAIHGDSAGWTTVRFDCWDHGCPLFDAFVQAFRTRRWLVQTHFHFANWYEDVLDASLETYLARRPAILINTLRRRQKHLERAGKYHYRVLTGNPDLEMGIQDYQSVYAASWKSPEPYPDFVPGLISAAAGTGCLRLGFLVVNARPVAAQIWLLSGGRATLFKMAHDRRFDRCSPGSLLTLHMLGRAIEAEGVTEVDFGRGDEAYKSLWLSKRRERWGMLAFNPRTLPGVLAAAGHVSRRVAGRCLRRVLKAST